MANTGNTQQIIDYGAAANDGTGDPLRTAFIKTDENFSNIWLAGPVGSNITIANNTIQSNNTNGNITIKPNGTGIVQVNAHVIPNIDGVRDLGSANLTWRRAYIDTVTATDLDATGDVTVQGNLTVEGDTIQIGNIVTDTLTIQLANTAGNKSAANGAGITVGANDAIATYLFNSTSNAWTTNIGISATGNVTAPYFVGNGSQLTGIVSSYANANVQALGEAGWTGNIIPAANATYSLGNVTNYWSNLWVANNTIYIGGVPLGIAAGNVLTVGGNAVLSNNSNTTISTTGNITANYFLGNGSQLTGMASTGNYVFANNQMSIANTVMDIRATGAGSDIDIEAADAVFIEALAGEVDIRSADETFITTNSGGNIWTFAPNGELSAPGAISATGNVTGGYIFGDGSGLTNLPAPIVTQDISSNGAMSIMLYDGTIKYNNNATVEPVSGNITSGNLLTGGLISATGNVTGNYIFGNGSQLTGILSSLPVSNGTSNINIATANGNVTVTSAGNTWTFGTDRTLTVPASNSVPGQISTQSTVVSEPGFDLHITAGNTNGCTVPGGDLYLSAGVGYSGVSHGAGNVNIVTGDRYGNVTGNIWRFDSSGALTLPLGGVTIKDTAGNAVAFGLGAGQTDQGNSAVAIGVNSGVYSQSANAVAVGTSAGNGGRVTTNYVSGAESPSTTLVVASTTGIVPGMVITGTGFFSNQTVVTVTNSTTLEISASAGFSPSGALNFTGSQGDNSVAIGTQAGQVQQGEIAVAIGYLAGNTSQGNAAVAIGADAGQTTQGVHAVAIGTDSGATTQGNRAVAIGYLAGSNAQGTAAVAIGYYAGELNQGNNSIIINATDTALQQTTANTFTVAPIRNDVANVAEILFYNTTSKEITYGNTISVAGNVTGNYVLGNGSQLTSINAVTVDITDTNGLTTVYYPTFVENRTTAQIARADVDLTYRTDDNLLTVGNVSVTGNITGNTSGFAIGYRDIPQVAFTGNATIATADAGKHFYSTQSTDYVLTIANNASQGFQTGAAITVINQGTGNITLAQGSGVTLYLTGNATSGNRTVTTFGMATLIKVATDTWFVSGAGVI